MRRFVHGFLLASLCLGGCASMQDQAVLTPQDCPAALSGSIAVGATSTAIAAPASYEMPKAVLARRIAFSISLGGQARRWTISSGKLRVHTFGGTLAGWTELATQTRRIDLGTVQDTKRGGESVAALVDPGLVTIDWSASRDASNTLSVDVLVKPGGIEVQDLVVKTDALWSADGAPVKAETIAANLVAAPHPPGYGPMRGNIDLDLTLAPRGRGPSVHCAATATVAILDDDAVRQPYWDIGFAERNQVRSRRLTLYSRETGPVPAMFDSLPAAQAFLSWLAASGSTSLGPFRLLLDGRGAANALQQAEIAKLRIDQLRAPEQTSQTASAVLPVPKEITLPK